MLGRRFDTGFTVTLLNEKTFRTRRQQEVFHLNKPGNLTIQNGCVGAGYAPLNMGVTFFGWMRLAPSPFAAFNSSR
jgi:hypothetical protein